MKAITHPIPILGLAGAVCAAMFSNLPLMILGIIVAIASVGLLSAKTVQGDRALRPDADMPLQSKLLLQPVRKEADRIESLVMSNRDAPLIQIAGTQCLETAKSVLASSASLIAKRHDLENVIRLGGESADVTVVRTKLAEIDKHLAEAAGALRSLFQELASTLAESHVQDSSEALRERIAHASALSQTLSEVDSLISPSVQA